ncbi:Uncharacterised protein [Bordetella pertussis]|nr:Uncharacterised protein [Bordetella pertussis]
MSVARVRAISASRPSEVLPATGTSRLPPILPSR